MAITLALLVIVVGSVLFHVFTPWWLTPLASNWKTMDDTLTITVVITGVFFVLINLFVVYTLWRYRHGRRSGPAQYKPDNPKLERWLIGITTVGIVALLAPGLVVYADYVRPPKDALQLEIVGRQWQWHFRFPGESGQFGTSDARFVSGGNPLGLDPKDPATHDNIVIVGNEVHLPLNRPVKVVLRSHDVLHDFFVPQFRARMNIVPGQVSAFWFTPTRPGRYESMCAQLCGVGHPNMRGFVVVEDEASFNAWLAKQPRFKDTLAPTAPPGSNDGVRLDGAALAQAKGCTACHSSDGSPSAGPTWKGLYGKVETLRDGTTAKVDDEFIKAFIRDPKARGIQGYAPIMPKIDLTEDEIETLTAHIRALGGGPETRKQP